MLKFPRSSELFLSIGMIISIHVPMLVAFGILFLGYRFFIDAHRLLTLHRLEMDSFGRLPHAACRQLIGVLAFAQIAFLIKFIGEIKIAPIVILGCLLLFTIIVYFLYRRPFLRLQDFRDKDLNPSPETLEKWHAEFAHPLALQDEYADAVDQATDKLSAKNAPIDIHA
jgi:hypothetical protein